VVEWAAGGLLHNNLIPKSPESVVCTGKKETEREGRKYYICVQLDFVGRATSSDGASECTVEFLVGPLLLRLLR
jgi:hypothetical protein